MRKSIMCVSLLVCLAACASQTDRRATVPFHVAVLEPSIALSEFPHKFVPGKPTGVQLQLTPESLVPQLVESLGATFVKVSRIEAAAADPMAAARAAGADLLVATQITYEPPVQTELNENFWPNLILFALGGPASWLISDRTYYGNVAASIRLDDTAAATDASFTPTVLQLGGSVTSTNLSFLARADGVGAYLLSLIVPAGLLAAESNSTGQAVRDALTRQLADGLATSLADQENQLLAWQSVAFTPLNVTTVRTRRGAELQGQIAIRRETGLEGLYPIGYRLGDPTAPFATVETGAPQRTDNLLVFDFAVPLGAYRGLVQLRIQQRGGGNLARTFTYLSTMEESNG